MTRARLQVTFRKLPDGVAKTCVGREAATLLQLVDLGHKGLSGLECGATRLSGYIFDLRHEFGLNITSTTERHGGLFAGSHARYRLLDPVEIISRNDKIAVGRAA